MQTLQKATCRDELKGCHLHRFFFSNNKNCRTHELQLNPRGMCPSLTRELCATRRPTPRPHLAREPRKTQREKTIWKIDKKIALQIHMPTSFGKRRLIPNSCDVPRRVRHQVASLPSPYPIPGPLLRANHERLERTFFSSTRTRPLAIFWVCHISCWGVPYWWGRSCSAMFLATRCKSRISCSQCSATQRKRGRESERVEREGGSI